MNRFSRLAVLSLCCAAPVALGESVFTFDNVTAGTSMPLSLSQNGLTAVFGGSGSICSATGISGNMFVSLTGNALMQGYCNQNSPGELVILFSSKLQKVTLALAINGTDPSPVTVTYLNNGLPVSTQVIQPAVPTGSVTVSPEATVTYSGAFNEVTMSSAALLAIDNVDAVPAQ